MVGEGGGIQICTDQRYEGVCSNVISVIRGWGVQFPEKKHYVTLECEVMFCDDVSLCFIHSVNYTTACTVLPTQHYVVSYCCICTPSLCPIDANIVV